MTFSYRIQYIWSRVSILVGWELYWTWASIWVSDCSQNWRSGSKVTCSWWLWTLCIHHLLMGNSRSLNYTYIRQFIPSVHHFFEDFLFSGFSICLILFANNSIFRIAKGEKVSLCVESTIGHRLIWASCDFTIWILLSMLLLPLLPLSLYNWGVFPDRVNSFGLIALIVQKWHMSCKLLWSRVYCTISCKNITLVSGSSLVFHLLGDVLVFFIDLVI